MRSGHHFTYILNANQANEVPLIIIVNLDLHIYRHEKLIWVFNESSCQDKNDDNILESLVGQLNANDSVSSIVHYPTDTFFTENETHQFCTYNLHIYPLMMISISNMEQESGKRRHLLLTSPK
jgi:hypothetical protein